MARTFNMANVKAIDYNFYTLTVDFLRSLLQIVSAELKYDGKKAGL